MHKCTFAEQRTYAFCGGNDGTFYQYDLTTDSLHKMALPTSDVAFSGEVSVQAVRNFTIAMAGLSNGSTQIYRSHNGGRTFVRAATLSEIGSRLWLGRDGRTVLVGTTRGDVYRSQRGGEDFSLVYDSPPGSQFLRDGVSSIGETDSGELLVTLTHCQGILWNGNCATNVIASTDGGASFSLRAETLMKGDYLTAADFGGMHHGVLLGPDVLATDDDGKTFKSVVAESLASSQTDVVGRELLTELALVSPDAGYAVKVWMRDMGRASYMDESVVRFDAKQHKLATIHSFPQHVTTGTLHPDVIVEAVDEEHVFLHHDKGLLRSQDGGKHFKLLEPAGLSGHSLKLIRFSTAQRGLLLSGEGAVFRTEDGGSSVSSVSLPAACVPVDAAYFDASRAIIACANGTILGSENGGKRFVTVRASSAGETLTGIAVARHSGVGWVFGNANAAPFLRTTDGGRTFRSVPRPQDGVERVVAISEEEALVAGSSLQWTRNGGQTWTSTEHPPGEIFASGSFGRTVYVETEQAVWRTQLP